MSFGTTVLTSAGYLSIENLPVIRRVHTFSVTGTPNTSRVISLSGHADFKSGINYDAFAICGLVGGSYPSNARNALTTTVTRGTGGVPTSITVYYTITTSGTWQIDTYLMELVG